MIIDQGTRKEARPIWFAASVILLLSAFRICALSLIEIRALIDRYTDIPLATTLVNVLFFWLLATLWLAFREWQNAAFREQELQRVVASTSPDVLMVVSPGRTITACNSAVKHIFGFEAAEVIGRNTDLLYADRRVRNEENEIYNSLQKVGFHVGYASGRHKNGGTVPLEIVTGNLKGRPGAVVLVRDISQREAAERELMAAKERVDRANKDKTEALRMLELNYVKLQKLEGLKERLTHMIVHDLKSPISAINGYLGILKSQAGDKLDEDGSQCLSEAAKLTAHLREMVITLPDVSRLESDQLPLKPQPCDLESLVREAMTLLGSDLAEKQMVIESPDKPVLAFCDPDVMRRVVVNMADNAVKFTPACGKVMIAMQQANGEVQLSFTDEGPGIPEQYHDKIFDHFGQVDARKFSTGVGLAFCKLAVEAHGGRIHLRSKVGDGSTFTVFLPIKHGFRDDPVASEEDSKEES